MSITASPSLRIAIIGNSRSGKSSLAAKAGSALKLPFYDLDRLHWEEDGRKRDEAEARLLVARHANTSDWIIEGVYGWLVETALPRAKVLIWLDLPWAECREGLLRRGAQHGETESDQAALLAWAGDYWTRTTSSSFAGHLQLYETFGGGKIRLQRRADVSTMPLQTIGRLASETGAF
ncbi:topology modulation protein [compost metagenome]|uniref:Adenylate kinase family enzyme n=1 Tax=Agrobacterium tumefaciens TaxID=358 RepID=A0AAW8LVW3_AGRTU|nr:MULTISPECIES: adenylate kinase [Agrobacterium]MBP2565742.1 adenylate kinase family enzyme [Agrobacterium tumefaciens]MDR6703025.1 adenylate kinase family enzyme [Agrobacterium tumefaciens]TCV54021.1 adenylate kinase family enzyme [Agrobacterium tumefaciens]UXS26337.1 adenylate kinase [Agrobacterium tumefaciens]UXS55165.1 adenylate kinase [Agrobacterium tumefaciens]